jgi:hypothetical protein
MTRASRGKSSMAHALKKLASFFFLTVGEAAQLCRERFHLWLGLAKRKFYLAARSPGREGLAALMLRRQWKNAKKVGVQKGM